MPSLVAPPVQRLTSWPIVDISTAMAETLLIPSWLMRFAACGTLGMTTYVVSSLGVASAGSCRRWELTGSPEYACLGSDVCHAWMARDD